MRFQDFFRKENSKSSQIQMFPDVSRLFQKKSKNMDFPDFSRALRTLFRDDHHVHNHFKPPRTKYQKKRIPVSLFSCSNTKTMKT